MLIEFLFNWEEAKKNFNDNKLYADDLILLLLDAGKTTGKTVLQKEVFLASKEIFNEIVGDLLYHPDKYGPYSKIIEDIVRILKVEGKIKVISKGEGHSTYFIQKNGKDYLKEVTMKKVDKSKIEELKRRKANWDEWGTAGILRYVYRRYPEYATKTKVPMLKWE